MTFKSQNKEAPRNRRYQDMFLQNLIGQKTTEDSLFQRLLFELESNYEKYDPIYVQLILEKHEDGQFEVIELIKCANQAEINANTKKFIKKKYWVEISPYSEGIFLVLSRKELSHKSATISKISPMTIMNGAYSDPDAPDIPLTEEDIIEGFRELCGIMQDHVENISKPKKAM